MSEKFKHEVHFPNVGDWEYILPGPGFNVIQVFPRILFRGEVLTIEESSPATRILLLAIGSTPVFMPLDGKGIPSSAYYEQEKFVDKALHMQTIDPALGITFWVRNESSAPIKWRAKISGWACK